MKILFLLITSLIFIPASNYADSFKQNPSSSVNQASDASFDKRLPPVLPGEELSDSGKKVKVWSSAGPVPDNLQVRNNCVANNNNESCQQASAVRDIDVIIDRRNSAKSSNAADNWGR